MEDAEEQRSSRTNPASGARPAAEPDDLPEPGWLGEGIAGVLENLEQQALGLGLRERDTRVDDLAVVHYGEVDLVSRLHASGGCDLVVHLAGGEVLRGRLDRVGVGVAVLVGRGSRWLWRPVAAVRIEGLSERSGIPASTGVAAQVRITSLLREAAATAAHVVVSLLDGTRVEGAMVRVGVDFVELDHGGRVSVVPLGALAVVRVAVGVGAERPDRIVHAASGAVGAR